MSSLAEVSYERQERLLAGEMDKRLDLLLANVPHGENPGDRYHAVTANPRSMGYLRFLLRHYAKSPHPWTQCVADNFKRFGPKTKGLCGVLKDTIRQNAMWRHGAPSGPHAGHPDAGSPGAAIGEADKWASPAWGGKHHLSEDGQPLSLLDELDMEFGVVDHSEPFLEAVNVLCALGEKCDVFRVLIGLDEPPVIDLKLDAMVPISTGDRVRRSTRDLSLVGPPGAVTDRYPDPTDGAVLSDVLWDDGKTSEGVREWDLRRLDR